MYVALRRSVAASRESLFIGPRTLSNPANLLYPGPTFHATKQWEVGQFDSSSQRALTAGLEFSRRSQSAGTAN
jgi:hypothetical protein